VEVVRFELDESNMSELMKSLNDVEQLITQHCTSLSLDSEGSLTPAVT